MLARHIRDALVHARQAPFTTAAKVVALALGLAAVVAVAATIAYWRSTDAGLVPKGSRIVEFTSWRERASGHGTGIGPMARALITGPMPSSSHSLAGDLRPLVPQIEAIARLGYFEPTPLHTNGRSVVLKGGEADASIFDVFDLELAAGSRDALQRKDAIVLTRSAAQKLFGSAAALGRSVTLDDGRALIVTAVLEPIPDPSRFNAGRLEFDYLVRMPDQSGPDADRRLGSTTTFARVPSADPQVMTSLRSGLGDLFKRINDDPTATIRTGLGLIDFGRETELRVASDMFGFDRSGYPIANLFRLTAWLILAVACLNYLNLSTAQALTRTKETATRRILGSGTTDLLAQSAVETVLTFVAAIALAALLLAAASPVLKVQFGANVLPALARQPHGLDEIGVAIASAALACAIYPALLAIRARPADALRSGRAASRHPLAPVLVGAQFAIASVLIVLVIVVGRQNTHVRDLALRPMTDPVVSLPSATRGGVPIATLRQALAHEPSMRAIGGRSEPPWSGGQLTDMFGRSKDTALAITQAGVEFGYFESYGQRVLAGRVFDPILDEGLWTTFPAYDQPGPLHRDKPRVERIVIDRDLASRLGFVSPAAAVGADLPSSSRFDPPTLHVIGVVEPRFRMMHTMNPRGIAYRLSAPLPGNTPLIRLDAAHVDEGLAALRRVWRQYANGADPEFKFEDQLFEESFSLFNRLQLIFEVLAGVAIAISTTGLIGMAVHTTQRRMHEIGVRKVLGSDAGQIVRLLLADFAKPVLIANLIAWPLAYFAVQAYLASFASRAALTPAPFIEALAATLLVAGLAVGGQTLRAAAVRPAQVLRDA
jgi:putative ABC transport system permease protein